MTGLPGINLMAADLSIREPPRKPDGAGRVDLPAPDWLQRPDQQTRPDASDMLRICRAPERLRLRKGKHRKAPSQVARQPLFNYLCLQDDFQLFNNVT